MAQLLLLFVLSFLSFGSIIDSTDEYQGKTIHTMAALTRDSTRAPIRIHYDLSDIELTSVNKEYLVNTVIE
jgi:hypothetical protein